MPIDFKKLLEEVRANMKLLEECRGPHKFVIHTTIPGTPLGRKFICELCKGIVESSDRLWYERGLKHAQNAVSTDQSNRSSETKPG